MKYIKNIGMLFFLFLSVHCYGQTSRYYTKTLDVKKALNLSKASEFGIVRKKVSTSPDKDIIEVKMYDKELYFKNENKNEAFMYGFRSNGATIDETENISFRINRFFPWFCYYGFIDYVCGKFYDRDESTKVYYHASNSLKFLRKLLHTKATYDYKMETDVGSGNDVFFKVDDTMEVIVTITTTGNAQLSDIAELDLPGLGYFNPQETVKNRIEVYRGDLFVPFTTVFKGMDPEEREALILYEGDSVVFKTSIQGKKEITGLKDVSIARWAGESIFMMNEVKHGDYKPFLFFDSNVHGIKMRTYPESWEGGKHKYPNWLPKKLGEHIEYSLSWIATGRRDYLIEDSEDKTNVPLSSYKKGENFSEQDPKFPQNGKFPNQNKFSGYKESLPIQRNNQKEGLNMEILEAYSSNKLGVAGLDPDELIYRDFNQSNLEYYYEDPNLPFNYVNKDTWKNIDQKDGHINAPLIKAFRFLNNFYGLNGGDNDRSSEGYYQGQEIMDEHLYIHRNDEVFIDGKMFDYNSKQPMFNHKKPIIYNPSRTNTPIFNASKNINWKFEGFEEENQTYRIAVLSPLEGKRKNVAYNNLAQTHRENPEVNFYGIITGPTFVARGQKNVKYEVKDLPSDVTGVFELVYTHEDSNGFLHEKRHEVSASNSVFILDEFGGGGYHEMTLQYRHHRDAKNSVILAGTELMDVDLRFIFSPDKKDGEDYSYNPKVIFGEQDASKINETARLSENKGSGNRWFLSDQNKKMISDDYGLNHGYKDHNVTKTYVLGTKESLTLAVLDADPHNFTHYNPDWYLSERRLSKRITDNDLANSKGLSTIIWTASKDLKFTQDVRVLGRGKHHKIFPKDIYGKGVKKLYIKAEFNKTSKVVVKIKVRSATNEFFEVSDNIGVVKTYLLSPDQYHFLKDEMHMSEGSIDDYRIFAVQDLYSTYEYGQSYSNDAGEYTEDDPNDDYGDGDNKNLIASRYTEKDKNGKEIRVGEHMRFSPKNNFDARFDWKFKDRNGSIDGFIEDFSDVGDNPMLKDHFNIDGEIVEGWFPNNWIRHLDGTPQSPEIPDFKEADYIKAFDEDADPNIEALNNNLENYEPWQVRLPWIAQTGLHGYRTRWNIKTIFDVKKLFKRNEIGKAFRKEGVTSREYTTAVNGDDGSEIIPNYTFKMRELQDFFWHLKTGRMIIVHMPTWREVDNKTWGKILVTVNNNPKGASKPGIPVVTDQEIKVSTRQSDSSKSLTVSSDVFLESSVSVFPNPSGSGVFNILISTIETSTVALELFDAIGKRVFAKKFPRKNTTHDIKIGEGLNLKTGVYILKVITNGKTENRKLIID
jgi:hypothetical protein